MNDKTKKDQPSFMRFHYKGRIKTDVGEHSLTHQSFKDESNINNILDKYQSTGIIENVNNNTPTFGDFSSTDTYQESLNKIMAAQESFDSLSAAVRKHFNNSPHEFVEFCSNPENQSKMVEMGLINAPPTPPQAPQARSQNERASDNTSPAKKADSPNNKE